MPIRKRDQLLFSALRRGEEITSRHLLEMDLGVYPPPGLNVPAAANDNVVSIQSLHQNNGVSWKEKLFSILATGGYVNDPVTDPATGLARPSPRTLFINPLLTSPAGAVMSVVAVFSLVNLAFVLAPISPLLALLPASIFIMTGVSSLRLGMVTSIIDKLYNSSFDTIGHEHAHILQRDDMERGTTGVDLMANRFKNSLDAALEKRAPLRHKFDNALSGNTLPNFMQDAELQARIHTVIAHQTRKYGRLPATRHELWAALIDAGLKAPAAITDELKSAQDTSYAAFQQHGLKAAFNRAVRGVGDKATAELNGILRAHLFDDLKEKFWRDTLPYLYGHLVELYGDPAGLNRMGFPQPPPRGNPAPQPAAATP